jgi:tetratricopeptide (TPR) repeat protein
MASGPAGTGSVPFAAAIIVYFSAIGFFAGYVLTRMFFSLAFGRFDKGLSTSELERAAAGQLINPALDPETKEAAYNAFVYRLLYQPKPEGFTKAIQYAKEFLSENTAAKGSIFVNLACAYGQQYRHLKDHGGSEAALSNARDQALEAIKKALSLSPGSKGRLNELLHGSADPQDNDLQVFEKEKDFTDLLD